MKTQGINSKEQLGALFILQEETKEQKTLLLHSEGLAGTIVSIIQQRCVSEELLPPQQPPPSSAASLRLHSSHLRATQKTETTTRATLARSHDSACTHPDRKIVHSVHLQVLSYLQILHFSFVSVGQRKASVMMIGRIRARGTAAPSDPQHSRGFKARAVAIAQVKLVFAGRINKAQQQIPLCSLPAF